MKKWISRIELAVAGFAMCTAVFTTFLNVVMRYFFSHPIYQAEEIATSMFVWLVFIGAAACYGEKMHIGIDIVVNSFPPKLKKTVQLITSGLMIFMTGTMAWLSITFTMSAGSKLTAALRLPYAWIDAAAAIGFTFMFLHAIDFFVQGIRNYKNTSVKEDEA